MHKLKIPLEAEKVFSGIIFDVYQWKQQMFDGSYQKFERLKRTPTCCVIPVLQNNKVVILKEEQPATKEFFGFPGGRMEKGEASEKTAERELLEEAGLKAESLELLEVFQLSHKIDFPSYCFVGKNCKYISSPSLDSGERISLIEVSFDELIDYASKDSFRDIEFKTMLIRTKFEKSELGLLKTRLSIK